MKLLKGVLIGSIKSGKTSLLIKYADNTFNESFVGSTGVDFKIKTVPFGDGQVKLKIWDSHGGLSDDPIFYEQTKADFFLLTVDLSQSDEQISNNLNKYSRLLGHLRRSFSPKKDLMIVGTKCDLVEYSDENRFKDLVQASSIQNHLGIFEVSAKDGMNVQKLFNTLVEEKLKEDPSFKYKPESGQASTSGIFACQNSSRVLDLEQQVSQLQAELEAERAKLKPNRNERCTLL